MTDAYGQPVDPNCIAKAQEKFAKNFAKGVSAGDCLTDADASSVGATVDSFAFNLTQAITGGSPGPDICDGQKLKQAGTKAAAHYVKIPPARAKQWKAAVR